MSTKKTKVRRLDSRLVESYLEYQKRKEDYEKSQGKQTKLIHEGEENENI